jgi:hypothetical protein
MTSSTSSEDQKRQRIRNYFKKPKLKWPIIFLVIGLLMLTQSSIVGIGLLVLIAGAGRTHLKIIQIQEHYRGMDKGK